MPDLTSKKCVVCEVGGKPLSEKEAGILLKELSGWKISGDFKNINKFWKFKDFKSAFAFAGKVADLAEEEGHHPEITVGWGKVKIELTTHAVSGLSENDFILAAKIDRLN
ncbi:MAG TPA: 4a-hydroxytetrahydrobiopterin dehydratase [Candidatus Paceibacterota bacterium]